MSVQRVCVGVITGAHGVRGVVKVKSFTADPADLVAYGDITDEAGTRSFKIELLNPLKDKYLARIDGVTTREAADDLKGTELFVARDALPPPDEEEFYYSDLIGLSVVDDAGQAIGKVTAVFDGGAGDVVEIHHKTEHDGETVSCWPFTKAVFPKVDVAGGVITAHPPEVTEARADKPQDKTTS